MEAFVVVLVVVAIVGLLVWQRMETQNAVSTTIVETTLDPRRAVEAVQSSFGGPRAVLWTNYNGPATINKRRRGKGGGIVMSINVEPHTAGGSVVTMWASQTNYYLVFFANFAGVVNRRKRAIARLVTA